MVEPEDLIEMNENEIYTLLFPSKNNVAVEYAEVDYEYIHKELARQGVTLKLLHQEYLD